MRKAIVTSALVAMAACGDTVRSPLTLLSELTGSTLGNDATVLHFQDTFVDGRTLRSQGTLEATVALSSEMFRQVLAEQQGKGIRMLSPSDSILGDPYLLTRSSPNAFVRVEFGSDSVNYLLVVMDTSARTLRVRHYKISDGW
jgi:hypothetical protein